MAKPISIGIEVIPLFGMERSSALYNFFSGKGERTFSVKRSIALYNFFTGDGRALFLTSCRSIALHLYQMANLRSHFWNKSKRAIAIIPIKSD
ncbi:hypothetical protein [Microcoleus sp. herbarium12]|uniref:hypothetical protein n=1 Tax=Microcoleus sp. herbarium12 TaxID=3055437 RepID=UPI002FD0DDC4